MRLIALLLAVVASQAAAQAAPDLKGAGVAVLGMSFINQVRGSATAGKLGLLLNPSQYALDLNGNPIRKGYAFTEDVGASSAVVIMRLEPGEYTITTLTGAVRKAGFGYHAMDFNVEARFRVKEGAVSYIGRLDLVNVLIKDLPHEQQSGPAMPAFDAIDTGMATGTLAITLRDQYDVDVGQFRRARPAWAGLEVERAPMASIVSKRPLRSNLPHTLVELAKE